jgi:hypothetical protein
MRVSEDAEPQQPHPSNGERPTVNGERDVLTPDPSPKNGERKTANGERFFPLTVLPLPFSDKERGLGGEDSCLIKFLIVGFG